MDADSYYDLTLITSVAVAPGGDRVAFTADEFDPEGDERRSSVFVVPADGSGPPHRLSRASDAGSPRFSPDGGKLAFLAAREEDAGIAVEGGLDGEDEEDDEPESQVWVFDLERGGDARQATDREHGVAEFDWGPDGERLAVAARDPTDEQADYLEEREEGGPVEVERLQHKFDGTGWLDDVRTYLFVVDPEPREARRLDDAWDLSLAAAMGGLQPRWGPGGIAFRANPERSDDSHVADLHTVDPESGDVVRHTDGDLMTDRFRWAPDGDRIAFVGGDPESFYRPDELYVLGDGEYRSLSGDLDRGIAWTGAPTWIGEETLLAPIGDEGLTRLARFHADGAAPERVFDAQGEGRTISTFDGDGGTLALGLSDPGEGLDCFAADADELGAPTRLTEVNAGAFDGMALPDCRRVTFENDAGETIEGFAYLPADDPEERPLVLKIHGGPAAYDAPRFDFETAFWTDRGYVVLNVNYRGSTSYGREFSETIRGEWGPKETHDVIRGVEDAVDRGWADPDRLFVTGFSYGGMTTAHVVATTDRFAAAAAEHGIYDYRSAFGTDDSHRWWENEFGLPWEHPEAYDRASSLPDVGEIETPLLVTAGGEDWRCPPSQSEQLYVSVRKQGVPARLVVYPDEHHDVGDPDRAVHRLEELADWFATHDTAE